MLEIFNKLQRIYQKFHLNNVLPFVVLISYTLFGAAIFRGLELERDQNERELFRISYDYAFDQITRRILELRCDDEIVKRDTRLQLKYAEEAVNWFLKYLNLTNIVNERNSTSPWTWYGSMFYAGQLYTTIGYGLPVAKTQAGQIASVIYIMFGIPIFLIILKDVGRLLSRTFRKFYKRMRITRHASTAHLRHMSHSIKAMYNPAYLPSTNESLCVVPRKDAFVEDVEAGTVMSKKRLNRENAFPIPLALALLILWIGLSAALFYLYENEWGYLTSVYFFFVSISTVGLGDIVPSNKDMMLGYFLLILIGLSLLSMCINLIQVALERILDQLLQQYIDEIERVAAIAKIEVSDGECEKSPFEISMASGLLTVPMVKHQKAMRSIPRRFKDWVAESITNNMISSQLNPPEDDNQSDTESSMDTEPSLVREINPSPRLARHSDFVDRLREHIPAIRTVQALEKTRFYTPNEDFQSVLFNKFITNSKLGRFVDQVCETTPLLVHCGTQTEAGPRAYLASVEEELESLTSRNSSLSDNHKFSVSTNYDVESVFSTAFFDVQFKEAYSPLPTGDDFSVSTAHSRRRSSSLTKQLPDRADHGAPTCVLPTVPRRKSYQDQMGTCADNSQLLAESAQPRPHRTSTRIRSLPICLYNAVSAPGNPGARLKTGSVARHSW